VQREAPYEAQFNAVQDHLMVLHLNGPVAVERRLDGKCERRIIPPGGLFILPGGLDFGVRLEAELDTLHIYLRNEVVHEVADELGIASDDLALMPSLGEPDQLAESLAYGVQGALTDEDTGSSVYVDYISRVLSARLLRRYSRRGFACEAVSGGLTRSQLMRAEEFIASSLEKSLSLEAIASACDLSPSYFARRFRSSTGLPPHQYLMRQRVERAKRLLRGSLPIVEVALECGFSHQEHLTNVFRRMTGTTPASYRRSVQG
jgi:AraC family transcriptional regulator